MSKVKNTAPYRKLFLLLLTALFLVGCQSPTTFYRGYLSDNQSVTPLTGTAQTNWQTFDIDLEYQTKQAEGRLDIIGTIDFGLFHQLNSARINRFELYLFFLDDQGRVLQTATLLRRHYISPENRLQFDKSLPLPSGAESIALGYEGMAREDGAGRDTSAGNGSGGGGSFLFYDLPKRSD